MGPGSDAPDPRNCRDLPDMRVGPASQPVPACLSGQSGVSPAPPPDDGPVPADRSSGPHARVVGGGEERPTSSPQAKASLPPQAQPIEDTGLSPQVTILQRPQSPITATGLNLEARTPARAQLGTNLPAAERFASPPITMRRSRARPAAPSSLTLGEFLAAATKHIDAALPTPGRRLRRPLNFSPRHGRSAATARPAAAPPTAERRAQVQILRTLGIIGTNQKITPAEMKAYDGMFAMPIPLQVLKAMAALVDREIPACLSCPPIAPAHVEVACTS